MGKTFLLKQCLVLTLLAFQAAGTRLDIPGRLPTSKPRCKVKGRTKCRYSLIVNEVTNRCPTLMPHGQGRQEGHQEMQNEQPSAMSHLYVKNMKEVQKKVQDLETKLYSEMVKNRQLQTAALQHEQAVSKVEKTMEQQKGNLSDLISQLKHLHTSTDRQKAHYRSIDGKLAGVMLDIVEINNVLEGLRDSQAEEAQTAKVISVEPSSKVSVCSISPNATKYRDCDEVYQNGHTRSGVYYITSVYAACPIPVYCDMDTPPGGWLVIQRRQDASESFNRRWHEYSAGFGDVNNEFWLGNDNLFLLTNQFHYQLRVDLWDFYGSRVYAEYKQFKVDGQRDKYKLHLSNHTGTAPDGLGEHDGSLFSTPDHDNDQWEDYHCAKEWSSGWWFSNCWFVILNGLWHNTTEVKYRGISWNEWKAEQLMKVEMKIRPSGF